MKKLLYLLLAALLCFSLAACDNDDQPVASGTVSDDASTTEPEGEVPDIPLQYDFEGYEFNFLTAGNQEFNEFDYEEESSISLDNAKYKRKTKLEADYNITIIQTDDNGYSSGGGPGFTAVSRQVNSGDVTYDLCLIAGYDVSVLAYSGLLYDMNSISSINLDKSWWDHNATDSLSVKGTTFFTTGDLTTSDNVSAYTLAFNKKLLNNYGLESPYDLVYNGEWTIEKLAEYCKTVSEDVNQDSKFDENDRYGLLVWDDSITGIVNAAGQRCCTINDEGDIELTFYNESTLSALEQFTSIAYDKQYALTYQRYNAKVNDLFVRDLGLFATVLVGNIPEWREMESDFGLLPYPMLSENQDDYYTTVAPYNNSYVCIPLVQTDVERTGVIAEAMSYYGQKTVLPALYDVTLIGQGTRDEDSSGMLDIIFDNLVYDIGYIYQIGPYNKQLILHLRNYNSNFASMYETYSTAAKGMLNLINMQYDKAIADWQE